MPPGNYV